MTECVDETLRDRGRLYGSFSDHAVVSQGIKRALMLGKNWGKLDPDQREAVEMIAHKMARILNGDQDHLDSWHDIQGYARLVEQRLVANKKAIGVLTDAKSLRKDAG